MNRRVNSRERDQEINILFTTTRREYYRKKMLKTLFWTGVFSVVLMCFTIVFHASIRGFLKWTVYENPAFAISEIRIESRGNFTQAQIRQATGLAIGANILGYSLSAVERDVERLPYVAEAQVERKLPSTIIIRIVERQAVARIPNTGKSSAATEFYVDRNGMVLEPREGEVMPPMPLIVGLNVPDMHPGQTLDQKELMAALDLVNKFELSELHGQMDIRKLDLDQPLCMKGHMADGMEVLFRLDSIPEQLVRLQKVLKQETNRTVATIDLTPVYSVPVTFKQDPKPDEATTAPGSTQPATESSTDRPSNGGDVPQPAPTRTARRSRAT